MKSTRFKQRSEFFLIADITVKVWLLVFVVANIQLHMSGIYTGTCPSLDGPALKCEAQLAGEDYVSLLNPSFKNTRRIPTLCQDCACQM